MMVAGGNKCLGNPTQSVPSSQYAGGFVSLTPETESEAVVDREDIEKQKQADEWLQRCVAGWRPYDFHGYHPDWRPGLKPSEPQRTKPFLTADDLVMLRKMRIKL